MIQRPPKKSKRSAFRECLAHPRFLMLTFSTFLVAFVFMQIHSTLSLQMNQGGYTEFHYGCLLALNGVLIIFFEIPLVPFTNKFKPTSAIAVGYLLIAFGVLAFGFFDHFAVYILGMTFFTFGELISMPLVMTLVSKIAPPDQRGQFMGFHGLAWGVALAVGPSLGILLFHWDAGFYWKFCFLMAAAGGCIVKRLKP